MLLSMGTPAVLVHTSSHKQGCTWGCKAYIRLRSSRLKLKSSSNFSFSLYILFGSVYVSMNIPCLILCRAAFLGFRRCFETWRNVERFDQDAKALGSALRIHASWL